MQTTVANTALNHCCNHLAHRSRLGWYSTNVAILLSWSTSIALPSYVSRRQHLNPSKSRSIEDLSCFNSEIVVRAISECSIPVVTRIGHERDESLAVLVADVRMATPTAAAAIVVPTLEDLADEHSARVEQLRGAMQRVLIDPQSQLDRLRIVKSIFRFQRNGS